MGKKLIGTTAAIAAIATAVAAGGPATAMMVGPANAQSENAAILFQIDGLCMINRDGFVGQGDIHYVDTRAANKSPRILMCQGQQVGGAPIEEVTFIRNYNCFTPFGTTTNSQTVISPGGKWTSICKFTN